MKTLWNLNPTMRCVPTKKSGQQKFEEFKLANLVSEVSAHLKKKKSITKSENVGNDEAFEC